MFCLTFKCCYQSNACTQFIKANISKRFVIRNNSSSSLCADPAPGDKVCPLSSGLRVPNPHSRPLPFILQSFCHCAHTHPAGERAPSSATAHCPCFSSPSPIALLVKTPVSVYIIMTMQVLFIVESRSIISSHLLPCPTLFFFSPELVIASLFSLPCFSLPITNFFHVSSL